MSSGEQAVQSIEERFERSEDLDDVFDFDHPVRINRVAKRISMDIEPDMVRALDREAERLGVNRQAVIKIAIDRYLDERAACELRRRKAFEGTA